MQKNKIKLDVIAEVAIFSALAFALDMLQGGLFRGLFPNGGSIGIAMIPVLVIAYRRGLWPGLVCGLIVSLLQMLGGIYAIADKWYLVILQISLDYVIAYPLVAVAGLFHKSYQKAETNKQKIWALCLGTTIGGLLKLAAHYAAGVIFWSYTCPADFLGGPAVYSLVYNGGYMLPNIIISAVVLVIVALKQPTILTPNTNLEKEIVVEGE